MTPEEIEETKKLLSIASNDTLQSIAMDLLAALEEPQQANTALHEYNHRYAKERDEAKQDLAEAQQTIARQREVLEGIQRIIETGEFYETADQLKSVLVSANWACADALGEGAKES